MKNPRPLFPAALLLLGFLTCAQVSQAAADYDEAPVPVRMIAPKYPEDLRDKEVRGLVTISCQIDEKGAVREPKVVKSTNEGFNKPTLEAIVRWKFKPAKKAGAPVAVQVNLPVEFNPGA